MTVAPLPSNTALAPYFKDDVAKSGSLTLQVLEREHLAARKANERMLARLGAADADTSAEIALIAAAEAASTDRALRDTQAALEHATTCSESHIEDLHSLRGRILESHEDAPASEHIAHAIARGVATPLQSFERLRRLVLEHRHEAATEARKHFFVDLAGARRVARQIVRLIDQVGEDGPIEDRRLVQAAALYFIDRFDDSGDYASAYGFDDDAEVVRTVAHSLGVELKRQP